jgi:hypothetical protein
VGLVLIFLTIALFLLAPLLFPAPGIHDSGFKNPDAVERAKNRESQRRQSDWEHRKMKDYSGRR